MDRHAETERAGRVHHPDGFANPARLRELDVDAMPALGASPDIGKRVAVLVDVDRDRRLPLELRAVRIAGDERLLAVLDAEVGEVRQRVEGLVERPRLVHVDLEAGVADGRAHGAHALDVEAVARTELELEPPEPWRRTLRPPRHLVGVAEPHRPRRRRPRARETQKAPNRKADELAA